MKKRQHYFDILKAFFVRHSSEYRTSDSDRKVNRNTYPDAVTRDRMRLIDPKSGQLGTVRHTKKSLHFFAFSCCCEDQYFSYEGLNVFIQHCLYLERVSFCFVKMLLHGRFI